MVGDKPEILGLRETVRRRARRRGLWAGAGAAAACIAAAMAGPVLLGQLNASRGFEIAGAEQLTRFSTGVGQVSRVRLADGSTVVLDADSALSLRFGRQVRNLTLERGRAFFEVAHESRPFIVAANRFSVRATGTQFVVDRAGPAETLSLIEGSVVATASAPVFLHAPMRLQAGARLSDDGEGRWRVNRVNVEAERDWMSGRLTFNNERVDRIVLEMNRYARQRIVVADPRLANTQISAVLRAGDTDTLVSTLSDLGLARVASRDAGTVVLTAR